MSYHKKVLIAYAVANLLLIVLGYFQLHGSDSSLTTDQQLAAHGVTYYFWPLISLFMTSLIVAVVYALRGLWLLGAWAYHRIA